MSLILLPSHPDYSYPRIYERREVPLKEISPPLSEDNAEQLTRSKLREYMIVHSVKGTKPMPKRSPFVGQTKTFASPIDDQTHFAIRRLSVQQVMTYRDRNSVVRFITEEESGRYTQEKDYPAGTMNLDLVVLGLASWNIQNLDGTDIKITEDTVKSYLDPEELDFIAEKVLEVNPILTNRGNQKRPSEENAGSTTGSNSGANEPSGLRSDVQESANGSGGVSGDSLSAQLSAPLVGMSSPS